MPTECNATLFEFEAVERRAVVAGFDGGDITSNAGALLLGQVDRGLGLIRRFGECFTDRRDPRYVEHRIETLVGQRIFGLVLGYEDPPGVRQVAAWIGLASGGMDDGKWLGTDRRIRIG